MSSDHNINDTAQLELEAGRTGTRQGTLAARAPKLTNNMLCRHLAEVAALSQAEGDSRMAEHLVDVIYHFAGAH